MALNEKARQRISRKSRIKKKLLNPTDRPRMTVFKSSKYIYAQIIDDAHGQTLAAGSSLEKALKTKLKSTSSLEASKEVGKLLAERAKAKKVDAVVFDRNGFEFHGRIKALADAAREAGLKF